MKIWILTDFNGRMPIWWKEKPSPEALSSVLPYITAEAVDLLLKRGFWADLELNEIEEATGVL